jgi:RNA polymerase sigma-70 factor (ECF subfamily)
LAAKSPGIQAPRRGPERPAAPAFRLARAEERRLIRAARAGDRRALDRLVSLLSGPVYRYGRSFCGDHHDAEDVSQAVLMALVRTLADFRGEASLATWTYTVARRACMRMRRTSRHAPRVESLEAAGETGRRPHDPRADPSRDAERADLRAALARALRALPRGQREVVVLRDVEGFPAREVAALVGIDEGAVKARLHRGRAALREALAAYAEPGGRGPRARKLTAARATGDDAIARVATRVSGATARCGDSARLLRGYLEGELDARSCERLRAHLDACPDCGPDCARLRVVLDACRAFGRSGPPPELRRRLRAALRALPA